jgi:glucose/arabinose dehydrogenase
VHGLVIGGGYVWFTTSGGVWRTPYVSGQRGETPGGRQQFSMPRNFFGGRWTHGLARSPSGALYTTNADSTGSMACSSTRDDGHIFSVDDHGVATVVATGFRNPMYARCHFNSETCLASELGEDEQRPNAREKILRIRSGTWYGYPYCYAPNLVEQAICPENCAQVVAEEASFPISNTPFGLDWERGMWPGQYRNALFVALHGSFYSPTPFEGASVVYTATDANHIPISTQDWHPFVTGFSRGPGPLSRPADVAFSPDGRLYVADDTGHAIYWVAPLLTPRTDP